MPEGDGVSVDLGAEKIIAAEKGTEKIAVEIKSFTAPSVTHAYHEAAEQYLKYVIALHGIRILSDENPCRAERGGTRPSFAAVIASKLDLCSGEVITT
jgi:hypothetical protein